MLRIPEYDDTPIRVKGYPRRPKPESEPEPESHTDTESDTESNTENDSNNEYEYVSELDRFNCEEGKKVYACKIHKDETKCVWKNGCRYDYTFSCIYCMMANVKFRNTKSIDNGYNTILSMGDDSSRWNYRVSIVGDLVELGYHDYKRGVYFLRDLESNRTIYDNITLEDLDSTDTDGNSREEDNASHFEEQIIDHEIEQVYEPQDESENGELLLIPEIPDSDTDSDTDSIDSYSEVNPRSDLFDNVCPEVKHVRRLYQFGQKYAELGGKRKHLRLLMEDSSFTISRFF